MKEHEAEQVICAPETGRRFSFSNYHPGMREVLECDLAEGRFVLAADHADESDRVDRSVFTREELAEQLRQYFSYEDFGLPPAEEPEAPRMGRCLSIHWKSDDPDIAGDPFLWIELSYRGVVYKGNDLSELLQNLKKRIHSAMREGRPFRAIHTSAGSPAAVHASLPTPPGANQAEKLLSLEKMIAALERRMRE